MHTRWELADLLTGPSQHEEQQTGAQKLGRQETK
jgi:hypothetical protein